MPSNNLNRQPQYNANEGRRQAESSAEQSFGKSRSAREVIDAIANYCKQAERSGSSWKCVCPICNQKSLSVTLGRQIPVLIQCWHCKSNKLNDGHTEQRAYFVDAGILEPDTRAIKKLNPEEYEADCRARRHAAEQLWNKLYPIKPEYKAAKYLCARGLGSFVDHPAFRTAAATHPSGCGRQVFAARLWHVHFGLCAVQVTYLDWGSDDRDRELKPGRMTYGPMKGGAVWIGAPRPDEEFVVGEGLETVLSAMLLLDLRCGAAVLGPNLKSLELPSTAKRIHIAADNDDTGRGAAEYAEQMWRAQGLIVRVSVPEVEGEDFNDVLRRRNHE